jgi:hypothetical protein
MRACWVLAEHIRQHPTLELEALLCSRVTGFVEFLDDLGIVYQIYLSADDKARNAWTMVMKPPRTTSP